MRLRLLRLRLLVPVIALATFRKQNTGILFEKRIFIINEGGSLHLQGKLLFAIKAKLFTIREIFRSDVAPVQQARQRTTHHERLKDFVHLREQSLVDGASVHIEGGVENFTRFEHVGHEEVQ